MALLSKAPPPPTKSLTERIEALHEEIEALLDAKVEQLRAESNYLNHPVVIRQTLMRGNFLCVVGRQLEKMS